MPLGVQEGLPFRDQNFRAVPGITEAAAARDSTGLLPGSWMSPPRAGRPLTTTLSSHHLVNVSQTYSPRRGGPISAPPATLPQAGALCSQRLSTAICPHPCSGSPSQIPSGGRGRGRGGQGELGSSGLASLPSIGTRPRQEPEMTFLRRKSI